MRICHRPPFLSPLSESLRQAVVSHSGDAAQPAKSKLGLLWCRSSGECIVADEASYRPQCTAFFFRRQKQNQLGGPNDKATNHNIITTSGICGEAATVCRPQNNPRGARPPDRFPSQIPPLLGNTSTTTSRRKSALNCCCCCCCTTTPLSCPATGNCPLTGKESSSADSESTSHLGQSTSGNKCNRWRLDRLARCLTTRRSAPSSHPSQQSRPS